MPRLVEPAFCLKVAVRLHTDDAVARTMRASELELIQAYPPPDPVCASSILPRRNRLNLAQGAWPSFPL